MHAWSVHDHEVHSFQQKGKMPVSVSKLSSLSFDDLHLSIDDTVLATVKVFKVSGVIDHFHIEEKVYTFNTCSINSNCYLICCTYTDSAQVVTAGARWL